MEVKILEKLPFKHLTGAIKNIKTIFSKTPKSPLKIYDGAVEDYPYANLKAFKSQVQNVELKKAQALAEFHRKRMQIY